MTSRLSDAVMLVLLSCFVVSTGVSAEEPPAQPILRVETGMHTAAIRAISVDQVGKYVVTGSDDKTVRLWELPSGRLVRTIRVPGGVGAGETIFAVAISPDGSRIAAGGDTSIEDESIYVFDRQSGRLEQRIDLPTNVYHLTFSPDGEWLAVAGDGIRLYKGHRLVLAAEDSGFGSYGVSFDGRGRLVASVKHASMMSKSSVDGSIRLYNLPTAESPLRLIAEKKSEGGAHPYRVAFSPDGNTIAVGFLDSTRVALVSGFDLASVSIADNSGIEDGNFSEVAWSRDGANLYASGTARSTSSVVLRIWSEAGRGEHKDVAVASNTVLGLAPLRLGVLFASALPGWGRVSMSGDRDLNLVSHIVDYRGLNERLLVSGDGDEVQFEYEGQIPARLAATKRRVTPPRPLDRQLLFPRQTPPEGKEMTGQPKLWGVERACCISFASDGSLLVATNLSIYLFDRSAEESWAAPARDTPYSVNIAGNDSLAIVAYADGTIRWYRMTDGQELLAFFPHTDRKRWILWTPSGYYDASPGAEELIGWHVNNGKDAAADFYPASQFRSTFYRPDIIGKVLSTLDEAAAIKLANEERGRTQTQTASVAQLLPPVVEITSPADATEIDADTVTIRFAIRTPSGEPVTNVRVLVDGRPIGAGGRGVGVAAAKDKAPEPGAIRELTVPMPPHDADVSIIAENSSAASVPATIHLRWKGKQAETFVVKPKLYVLAVGVSKYENPELKLAYPAKDANDFAAALVRQKGGLYREVEVKLLTDEKATRDEIADGLDWLSKETTSKDVAAVFLAGHGVNDSNGQFFFLPYNADTEKLRRTGVSFSDVQSVVQALAGKTLFFVDSCHSGNVMGTRRGAEGDINRLVNELSSAENGAVVFAASTGRQYSLEDPAWGNGAFTKALVEGLSGKADYNRNGKITINMLDLYISERVKELTKGQQTPTTTKPNTVQDFPVAVTVKE